MLVASRSTARPPDAPHIPLQHHGDGGTRDTHHDGHDRNKDDSDFSAVLSVYDGASHLVDALPLSHVEPFTLDTLDALIEQREALGKRLLLARVATLVDLDAATVEHGVRYFFYDAHCLNKILFRCFGRDQDYLFRLYALNPMTNTDIVGDVDYFIVEREPISVVLPAARPAVHGTAPPKAPPALPDLDAIVTPSGVLTLTDDARATLSDIAAVSAARRPSVMSTTSETGCLIQHRAALDDESDDSLLPPPRPTSPTAHPLPLSRTASARSTVAVPALPGAPLSGTESTVTRQFAALMERSLGANVAGIKIAELVGPNLDRVLARSAYHLHSASGVAAPSGKTGSGVMVHVSTKSSDSILAKTMPAARGAQARSSQLDLSPPTNSPNHRSIPRSVDDIAKRTTLNRPTRTVSDRAPAAPRHPRPDASPTSAVRSDCHLDTPPLPLDRPISALAVTTTPLHLRASITQLRTSSGGDERASGWKLKLRAKAAQGPPRPTTSADTIAAQFKSAGADAAVRGSRASVAATGAPAADPGSKRPSSPRTANSGSSSPGDSAPTVQPRIISGVRGLTRPGLRSIPRARSNSTDSLPPTPTGPTYRAVYIGSDDDYLALGHIRHLFAANAVSADDMRLFAIPPEVLLEEGILLPDLVNDPDLLAMTSGATLDASSLPLSPRYGTPAQSAFFAQQWDRFRGPTGRRRRTIGAVAALGLCALALQVIVDPHAPLVTLVAVAAALIGVVALIAVLERAACVGRGVVENEEVPRASALPGPDMLTGPVVGEDMVAWDAGSEESVTSGASRPPLGQGVAGSG
ncbi:hypothetical protein AMAG_03888 [Allomyces macrogynus ATCC 38327]|uniref:Uncharacterized protein n=1 Tax=Allomyces macrogynus (strain ATCC 38327) TaxID=578462 RepID=A0A0L0SAM8_ALLM3|nr:hypothetical protein AMAG_03888 [Allomyces macrogynus ATCC 38327]|eukprot:KNE59633.1 hypothetical protein AMAG_03888 [Allomyces macrogynus ATCC 38327]